MEGDSAKPMSLRREPDHTLNRTTFWNLLRLHWYCDISALLNTNVIDSHPKSLPKDFHVRVRMKVMSSVCLPRIHSTRRIVRQRYD